MKRLISLALVCFMFIMNISSCVFAVADELTAAHNRRVAFDSAKSHELNEQAKGGYNDDEDVRIMVSLEGETAFEKAGTVKGTSKYADKLLAAQSNAITKIERATGKQLEGLKQFTLLFNGFSFAGTAGDIDTINAMSGMKAYAVPSFSLPEPLMDTSADIVGAPHAWDLDYTGKGTAIAILDTGIRLTHDAFSVMPEDIKYTTTALAEILNENSAYMHSGNSLSSLYKSQKIPFAYDYEYSDYTPNHTASDHGTHVAGIAAGNDGNSFKGIAYDAQIVVMQVFSSSGSAAWDTILMALEDCAYLGVDSLNMSLGSGAGFTTYANEDYAHAMELLDEMGILAAAAAGNDGTTATHNSRNGYQLAMNPDSGVVSSPSTYYPCISVASSDNRDATAGYISAYGDAIGFHEPSSGASSILTMIGAHDFVYCGLGSMNEIPTSVSGKIALIKRGDLTFTEKAANARSKGARAVIVFNNIAGSLTNISVSSYIPFITISDISGEFLLEHSENGVGQLEIRTGDVGSLYDKISSFSSRGTTADLKIKPEITAPGGAITSAIGFGYDDSYATWNGTSMATPHVAGGMAIVKSYVKEHFPDATNAELANITNAILMGTATPLNGEMVTEQGAGLMNLAKAVSTTSYLTVNGTRPKLELDDSIDCTWSYSIELTNFGYTDAEYTVNNTFIIQGASANDISGDPNIYVTNGAALDVSEYVSVTGDSSITVAPGETKTISFSIDASEVMEVYGSRFPAGAALEGFVYFTSATETLSVPLLGYMGDWDYPSMFDRGFYWQILTGEQNLGSNPALDYNTAVTYKNGSKMGVGFNPYVTETDLDSFNTDWGALSPNGDGVCDSFGYIEFALLRNAKELTVSIETPNATDIIYEADPYSFKKEFYISGYGYTYAQQSINYSGYGLQEGETAYIKVTAILDHEGYTPESNECGEWVIPVTLDTTAPAVYVDNSRIAVFDEHYTAYTAVYSDPACTRLITASAHYGDKRGDSVYIDGCEGTVYVFAGDYAGNDAVYAVDLDTGRVSEDRFYGRYYENNSTGWSCDNATDGWQIITGSSEAYEGSGYVRTEDEGSSLTSPTVTMINAEDAYAKLFLRTSQGESIYHINVASGSSSTTLKRGTVGTEWECVSIDLSEYAGSSISFEIVCDELNGGTLMLDVFEIYTDSDDRYVLAYKSDDSIVEQRRIAEGDSTFVAPDPEKEGHTFTGWSEEAPAVMPKHDVIINAVYEVNTYTVTFTDYDGTVLSTQSVEYGSAATAPEAPTRENYTFIGWDQDFSFIRSDLTVTALYEINKYSVTFKDYDGTVLSEQTVEHGSEAVAPEAPTRENYTFQGWDKDFTNVTSDLIINAVYELNKYEVTFVDYDGTIISTQTVEHGSSANAPADPVREGYTFTGWDTDFSDITSDLTVTATYTINIYRVEFADYDGRILSVQMVEHGSSANAPADPVRDGYIFTGWDTDFTVITGNITITALYRLPYDLGDVNTDGTVNTADAVVILRHAASLIELSEDYLTLADVNADGVVNTADAVAILRFAAGLIDEF